MKSMATFRDDASTGEATSALALPKPIEFQLADATL